MKIAKGATLRHKGKIYNNDNIKSMPKEDKDRLLKLGVLITEKKEIKENNDVSKPNKSDK